MIKQLGHLNFFSDRIKEMLDFYTNKLGLKIKFTLDDAEGKPFGWYIECGAMTFIEIFDQAGAVRQWGGEVSKLSHGSFYRHLCLEVDGLEAYTQQLVANGVEVIPVSVGMDFSKQAWVKDPDGNSIELMEYTPKSFQLTRNK
jgi:lactoylglutathione lyase